MYKVFINIDTAMTLFALAEILKIVLQILIICKKH